MADLAGRAVAAVHAGWRGTAAGIVDAAARALTERFGVEPRDLLVAIGPCIHQCCYEVGPELREEFAAHGHDTAQVHRWFSKGRGDRWQLDVTGSNRDQLEFLGVPPDQIIDSGLCTACHPEVFHSYRRSGSRAGRMLGVIRAKTKSL
jgi:YfiH family protein